MYPVLKSELADPPSVCLSVYPPVSAVFSAAVPLAYPSHYGLLGSRLGFHILKGRLETYPVAATSEFLLFFFLQAFERVERVAVLSPLGKEVGHTGSWGKETARSRAFQSRGPQPLLTEWKVGHRSAGWAFRPPAFSALRPPSSPKLTPPTYPWLQRGRDSPASVNSPLASNLLLLFSHWISVLSYGRRRTSATGIGDRE